MRLSRAILSGFRGPVDLEVILLPTGLTDLHRMESGHILVGEPSILEFIERTPSLVFLVRRGTGGWVDVEALDGSTSRIETSDVRGWRKEEGRYVPLPASEVASVHDEHLGITPVDAYELPSGSR